MVLVPLASRWKNSMPSNQIEAEGLGCWLDFKGFALAHHNMNHGRGVCHTHSIVVSVTTPQLFSLAPHSHSLSPSFCLSDNCIIWPYRGIWNTAEQHLLAEPNRYANLFHSRRFDKLDCSSWKASFKHMAAATNPHSLLSLFSPLHLLLPPPSFFSTLSSFHLPPSLLESVELCLLRVKRVLGLQQQTWKEHGRKKYPSSKFFPLSLPHGKKTCWSIENMKWCPGEGRWAGDNTLDIKGVRWGECES